MLLFQKGISIILTLNNMDCLILVLMCYMSISLLHQYVCVTATNRHTHTHAQTSKCSHENTVLRNPARGQFDELQQHHRKQRVAV